MRRRDLPPESHRFEIHRDSLISRVLEYITRPWTHALEHVLDEQGLWTSPLDEPALDEAGPTTHIPTVLGYIRSIIALAKADVDTSVGSSINRAKS